MYKRLTQHSKAIICLLAVVLLMGGVSYADVLNSQELSDSQMWQQFVTLLAWLWIPIAKAAGALMTNSFVYGEFMNFDIYLWQMWNISKNFANMAIGFFFLYYILQNFFKKEENTGNEIAKKIG